MSLRCWKCVDSAIMLSGIGKTSHEPVKWPQQICNCMCVVSRLRTPRMMFYEFRNEYSVQTSFTCKSYAKYIGKQAITAIGSTFLRRAYNLRRDYARIYYYCCYLMKITNCRIEQDVAKIEQISLRTDNGIIRKFNVE